MSRHPLGLSTAGTAKQSTIDTDARTWSNVLAEVPLFANLSGRHLNKVARAGRIRRIESGTTIVRAGESGDSLYVILDGEVSIRRRGLRSLSVGTGSFFGELALLDGGPRTATVVAGEPVVVFTLTQSRFLKLLNDESAIAVAVLKELARRLRAVQATA
jgi:CRP/FNR family transcriptional regulator, cyclic AMP receptor protein